MVQNLNQFEDMTKQRLYQILHKYKSLTKRAGVSHSTNHLTKRTGTSDSYHRFMTGNIFSATNPFALTPANKI